MKPTRPILCYALAAFAAALLAVGCGGGTSSSSGSGPKADDKKDDKPAPRNADFKTTSEELCKEFTTDKEAAGKKYKDKILEVEGVVDMVMASPPTIMIKGFVPEGKALGYSTRFAPSAQDQAKALNLTKGQKLKIKGKFGGEVAGIFVDVNDVELVEVGADPAVPVTAVQLTKDYAADAKAADQKYKDKWLVVEGTYFGNDKDKIGVAYLILEGFDEKAAKPWRVHAAYGAGDKDAFAPFKKGDKIKIKGECGGAFDQDVSLSFTLPVK
jgi:hypothetical protein